MKTVAIMRRMGKTYYFRIKEPAGLILGKEYVLEVTDPLVVASESPKSENPPE